MQRYPLEWANALREMMTCEAELLVPAHGLPIKGTGRINRVLGDLAHVLETLVAETLELMNDGYQLNDIVHMVKVDQRCLAFLGYSHSTMNLNSLFATYGVCTGGGGMLIQHH